MDSVCGKLLTAVVILPLTAGNSRRRRNGSRYYDCIISSRVLFLVIFAIVIVFTASKSIRTHTEIRLEFVLLLLSLLMISTMVGFCVLAILVHKHGLQYVVAGRRNTSTPKLQVIFLWVFGLASVFYCIFLVGKQIECSVDIANDGKKVGGYFWDTLLFFNILMILCLFSQMIAVTYFSPYELKQTDLINFAMSMLLIVDVCIFVYITLISDTFAYIVHINNDAGISHCLKRNSTMIDLLHKSEQILRPNFTEFTLLSCTILLEIWSPTKVPVSTDEMSYVETQDAETIPLLPYVTQTQHTRGRRTACQLISLMISLSLGIGHAIIYVAMAMGIGEIDKMRYITEVYELTLKVMIMFAIFAGFFCLVQYCTPDVSSKGLKTRDYVYLLSAFGLFMMHLAETIGGNVSSGRTATILMYTSIFSIFQDYLQVVFLLHASRCKKADPRTNIDLLESILIFIFISNFIFWFNDSFLISEFAVNRILEHGSFSKDLQKTVYHVLLPVTVFFRFTSFLEYYATFVKYST
ncbi:uncharacterized protein LOC117333675 [Pecten maximus]|uniref:uncharacterized protein LOC117333675 n=1 Tax=Pecten maximus TaxID=6579 RepID=UPI001458532B|nr:uncharacterized protein LOC117333675 [Pecten maximus]XP_033748973.1 uncharacterized protein LOC117333675 [Pecten maximus]